MRNIAIGIDLAKSIFSTCTLDASGHVVQRQDLRREAFSAWLAQLPAGTLVAMEACSDLPPLMGWTPPASPHGFDEPDRYWIGTRDHERSPRHAC